MVNLLILYAAHGHYEFNIRYYFWHL